VAVPMAVIAIFAFFTRTPSFFIIETRVAGTLGDANAFGIYLGMMLPLLASLRVAWVAIPLFIGATVVSFSRTGLVAIATALALSLAHLGLRRYLLVFLACAIVFMAVWGIASSTTTGKRVADYQNTLETRQGLWALAAEVAMQHPLLGIGKGNWKAITGRGILPHNTFLSVMVDGGLFGFAIFMIPLTVWLWRGVRTPEARPWAIAVFVGLVGGLAVSLDNFRPFWLAVGVLVAVLLGAREGAPRVGVSAARGGVPQGGEWKGARLG
jgi:O-antigen ligase